MVSNVQDKGNTGYEYTPAIYYYNGSLNKVDISTQKAVKDAIKQAKQKINSAFFDDLSLHVAADFSDLDSHNIFSQYLKNNQSKYSRCRGITDDTNKREIYIQESAFWTEKIFCIFSKSTVEDKIKSATSHELGHQFDHYYGTTDEIKKQYNEIVKKYKNTYEDCDTSEADEKFLNFYKDNNGYSDKADFKKALYTDLQKINFKDLDLDEFYLVADFYKNSIERKPTEQEVQEGDYSRGEVFAQLFAYAMGSDDGRKDKFLRWFPNTYKVVQNYINLHQ